VRSAATFAGPAFLVSVGYIDPGNWGTDLAAGSRYGYDLLWVLVAANLLALLLQHLSARIGVATGRDLAAVIGERLNGAGGSWERTAVTAPLSRCGPIPDPVINEVGATRAWVARRILATSVAAAAGRPVASQHQRDVGSPALLQLNLPGIADTCRPPSSEL